MDKKAKELLMAVDARRELTNRPADLWTKVNVGGLSGRRGRGVKGVGVRGGQGP